MLDGDRKSAATVRRPWPTLVFTPFGFRSGLTHRLFVLGGPSVGIRRTVTTHHGAKTAPHSSHQQQCAHGPSTSMARCDATSPPPQRQPTASGATQPQRHRTRVLWRQSSAHGTARGRSTVFIRVDLTGRRHSLDAMVSRRAASVTAFRLYEETPRDRSISAPDTRCGGQQAGRARSRGDRTSTCRQPAGDLIGSGCTDDANAPGSRAFGYE
jgi:hypothetical protein